VVDHRFLRSRASALAPRAAAWSAGLLLLLVVGLLGFRTAYSDRIYPAVVVADVAVGGLDRDGARAALAARAEELERGTITFTYDGRVFAPTLAELGATVEIDPVLDRAYAVGREDAAGDRLRATGRLLQGDETFPLPIRLDPATLEAWFSRVDGELGLRPHDAYLEVDGTSVNVVPEVEGVVVNREAAKARIVTALRGLEAVAEPLPITKVVPAVRSGDLEASRAEVAAALARPVKVTFEGAAWTIEAGELAPFVVQGVAEGKTGGDAVTLELNREKLAAWLSERYAGQVYKDPVDATVGWNQGPVALTPSEDGHQLKPEAFAKAVSESFFGDHGVVPIPVDAIDPVVDSDNLGALGITTELARGDSNYIDSTAERSTNIAVGASLMNNTLIPPRGEFSFNGAIGEITEDKGYVEAKVIVAERIGKDIGGGICQVSTTVFRAALMAGLPITEWWPHSQRITSYERDGWGAGYDASILQLGEPSAWSDFRFENPTDSWMLVESWADGGYVIVKIYGEELGYDVQFSETGESEPIPPKDDIEEVDPGLEPGTINHTELPAPGLEVWFTRDVYDAEGNLLYSRKFYTYFPPHGNVYKVSSDMRGQSPAGGG
jgi:vancomycin resistance protein YoaR